MAMNLGVSVRFLFNDKNEDRMPNEMLSALQGHLKKHAESSIDYSVVDRLISSVFIGHKNSHDSSYKVSMGDCKAFWADVLELEKLYNTVKK
jgi:hypothetical protein